MRHFKQTELFASRTSLRKRHERHVISSGVGYHSRAMFQNYVIPDLLQWNVLSDINLSRNVSPINITKSARRALEQYFRRHIISRPRTPSSIFFFPMKFWFSWYIWNLECARVVHNFFLDMKDCKKTSERNKNREKKYPSCY